MAMLLSPSLPHYQWLLLLLAFPFGGRFDQRKEAGFTGESPQDAPSIHLKALT